MGPMNPKTTRHRDHHDSGRRPMIEALEGRVLLTSHPLGPALPGKHYAAPDVQPFVSILYPPGTPQPTTAEIRRESFDFKGVGRYTIGAGRFSDQALTIHGSGKPGTSNQSRRLHFQFVITEPSSTATDQAVYGDIGFVAGNYLQNSAELNLNFVGPKGSEMGGLPTHLYWTSDANSSSSGPFAETGAAYPAYSNFPTNYFTPQGLPVSPLSQGLPPTNVNNWDVGLGDAILKYVPDSHPQPGSLGSGTVILVMHGLRNYTGAQSQADNNIN
jgi:hypothetical protein